MSSFSTNHDTARHVLQNVDLDRLIPNAQKHFGLADEDIEVAKQEYRHFWYLMWWNEHDSWLPDIVPTTRADALWHAHLLDNGMYEAFCLPAFGKVIFHIESKEDAAGRVRHAENIEHTKFVHGEHGAGGFVQVYLDASVQKKRKNDDTPAAAAVGGDSPAKADAASGGDSGTASAIADGGSAGGCAAGCGGGG